VVGGVGESVFYELIARIKWFKQPADVIDIIVQVLFLLLLLLLLLLIIVMHVKDGWLWLVWLPLSSSD
jgi:hypothetical protein